MATTLKDINRLDVSCEKFFFTDMYRKKQYFSLRKDKQCLEILIKRINELSDGYSPEGQKIAEGLIKDMMEVIDSI